MKLTACEIFSALRPTDYSQKDVLSGRHVGELRRF